MVYFFLTDVRRKQFDLAIYIMKNNIIYFSDILGAALTFNILPDSAKGYVNLPFFCYWIIGFTISPLSPALLVGLGWVGL